MNESSAVENPKYQAPVVLAFIIAIILSAANLVLGDLNQDEGWYLYAARLVADGFLPYRDFAFTQGPVMPLVYSFFDPVVDAHGLAGGRYVTCLIGLAAAFIASRAAYVLGGRAASAITFSLLMVNVYQSYFTTVVKTYSLTSLFLVTGFYFLVRHIADAPGKKAPWLNAFLSAAFLVAAAGTRHSTGILLPVTTLWLLIYRRYWGRLTWLVFGFGGVVSAAAIFFPFVLKAPDGFVFGLIQYHTMREGGDLLSSLALKAGFVSRMVQGYFVAGILIVALLAAKWRRPFKGTETGYHQTGSFNLIRLLWISVAVMTLVHIAAPFPYDDYQVPVFPLLAIALAVSWSYALRAWSGIGYRWEADIEPQDPACTRWFVWSVLLVSTAASFSSPINQDWMVAGRDRIWWRFKDKPALLKLREVGREIRQMEPHGGLLTQDIYLAVEAGLDVPIGWEMGPFSYYPELSHETARRLKLRNQMLLMRDIKESCAEVAAVSGYGFSINSPDVTPVDAATRESIMSALRERYELFKTVPGFGQAATTLELYRLRDSESEHHHH